MKRPWYRRLVLALSAGICASLLLACGSGSIISNLKAERFIVVGDDFSDVGQNGQRFTVNDGSETWLDLFASHFDDVTEVVPSSDGGWVYAQGGARVATAVELDGVSVPSVVQQVDAVLARTQLRKREDVVFISGGMNDVIAAVQATGISEASDEAVDEAALALGRQVRRLVDAGGAHVAVLGVRNLGNTPWAQGLELESEIERLSVRFNTELLIEISDLGDHVLFLDTALFYNLAYNDYRDYGLSNRRDPVCTTPRVRDCTPATVVTDDYNSYMFASPVNLTPGIQRLFGDDSTRENAYTRFRDRW